MSENDCQCILAKNVRHICDKCKILKADLWNNCNLKKLSVFSENEIRECEGVVEMINEDELFEILAYISNLKILHYKMLQDACHFLNIMIYAFGHFDRKDTILLWP